MRFSATTTVAAALIFGSTVTAHMEMSVPAPFRGKTNKNAKTVDYDMTKPLAPGSELCKGYQTDFADASGAGAATASWAQGSSQTLEIIGGAAHDGGSCQVSISTDGGKSFTAIHSVQGGCLVPSTSIPFKVPADTPTGRAIVGWSWVNLVGNREFYMNCAAVEITAGSGTSAATAFSSRPAMFVANLGSGCKTVENKNTKYPNPGPDVVGTGDENSLTGDCGATSSPAADPAPADGSSQATSSVAIIPVATSSSSFATGTAAVSAKPTTLATSVITASSSAVSSAAGSISTGTPSGELVVSTDGTCGSGKKCPGTTCCSAAGFCGSSTQHCGVGCVAAFGTCAGNTTVARGLPGRFHHV